VLAVASVGLPLSPLFVGAPEPLVPLFGQGLRKFLDAIAIALFDAAAVLAAPTTGI
jgi:hypothetical protein